MRREPLRVLNPLCGSPSAYKKYALLQAKEKDGPPEKDKLPKMSRLDATGQFKPGLFSTPLTFSFLRPPESGASGDNANIDSGILIVQLKSGVGLAFFMFHFLFAKWRCYFRSRKQRDPPKWS